MITDNHKNLQVEIDSILRELKAEKITPEVARLRIDCVKASAGMHRVEHERQQMITRIERKPPQAFGPTYQQVLADDAEAEKLKVAK